MAETPAVLLAYKRGILPSRMPAAVALRPIDGRAVQLRIRTGEQHCPARESMGSRHFWHLWHEQNLRILHRTVSLSAAPKQARLVPQPALMPAGCRYEALQNSADNDPLHYSEPTLDRCRPPDLQSIR